MAPPKMCIRDRGYTGRPVAEARTAYDRLARGGNGAAFGGEDVRETGFEGETGIGIDGADETEAVEWDKAA